MRRRGRRGKILIHPPGDHVVLTGKYQGRVLGNLGRVWNVLRVSPKERLHPSGRCRVRCQRQIQDRFFPPSFSLAYDGNRSTPNILRSMDAVIASSMDLLSVI